MSFPTQQFLGFHKHGIAFFWTIVIDVAIYFILFPYKKYSFYVHAILGSIIIAFSLGWVFPLIIPLGLYQANNEKGVAVSIKTWFGVIFIGFSGILVITGILSRLFQQNERIKSLWVKSIKKLHYIIGYLTILICKASVLIGYQRTNHLIFWIILGLEIITTILFFYKKLYSPTLEEVVIDQQTREIGASIPLISAQSLENNSLLNYVIFSDFIYNIQNLKNLHPAGYQIVKAVSGRQIDRFLYGMYSAELLPQILPHSHSWKSMQLVGKPIAKLDIPKTYNNIPDLIDVEIQSLEHTDSNDIFILYLKPTDSSIKLQFLGYSDLSQLGQYYSLTINHKITRLYTIAHFLQTNNRTFISKMVDNPQIIDLNIQFTNKSFIKVRNMQMINESENSFSNIQLHQNGLIPLIIKRYNNGKLTSQLCQKQFNGTIQISCPKGLGLHFSSIPPGKIIIVAGGTGIYPFLDLIDLLYKQILIYSNHHLSSLILRTHPILRKQPLKNYQFQLMAAFRSPQDILPITLFQISQLCKSDFKFKVLFRINQNAQQVSQKFPQINFTKEKFDIPLLNLLKQQYSKIWICGPPSMNTSTVKLLLQNGVSKNSFVLI